MLGVEDLRRERWVHHEMTQVDSFIAGEITQVDSFIGGETGSTQVVGSGFGWKFSRSYLGAVDEGGGARVL